MIFLMNRDERATWGPLVRAARDTQGLTQQELAEMANTTRRTVGSIERGDSTPQLGVLERVLEVLGLWSPEGDVTPIVRAFASLDDDVLSFLALAGPLLQRLPMDVRADLMDELMGVMVGGAQGDDSASA